MSRPSVESSGKPPSDPRLVIRDLILGNQLTLAAIRAAVELGIPDRIGDGARTSDSIAQELGAFRPYLYRLLRALTVPGVLEELPGEAFRLLPLGESLRTNSPESTAPLVRFLLAPYRSRVNESLAAGILSGRVPSEIVLGSTHFEYLAKHPEDSAIFNAAMTSSSAGTASLVIDAYDFAGFRTLADIGGGHGYQIASILVAHPHLHGILFDLPDVVKEAPTVLRSKGVENRCDVLGGSFFDHVPGGADAHLLRQVLHDWDDAHAVRILRNTRRAIPTEGRVLVIDALIPDGAQPDASKLFDLNMLLMLGGRERTRAEMAAIFHEGGFRLSRVVPTRDGRAIVEGIPV